MADKPLLTYRAEPQRRPIALIITVLTLPVLIYLLFEFQRAPYRPPQDMSTFLDPSGITMVRMLMGVLTIAWIPCAAALGWIYRRRRFIS